MQIFIDLKPENLYKSIHELIRMAFPGCTIIQEANQPHDLVIIIKRLETKREISFYGEIIPAGNDPITCLKQDFLPGDYEEERNNLSKRYGRIFTLKLLNKYLDCNVNSYGVLTGVRPVKLVHQLLDNKFSPAAIINKLQEEYLVSESKARLLLEVALNNRPFLPEAGKNKKMVGLYIGIPYCPTRCYYCSFPGVVLRHYQEIRPFIQALTQEMEAIGEYLKTSNREVETIYIGGGTPTVLSEKDMAGVFSILQERFISSSTTEITVEAGRPDTLSYEKLAFLKQAGVTRICINPQTMNDVTLKRIGRNHNQKGVMQSVEWARKAGLRQINMDVIVGLPGEGIQENMHTAESILSLVPENITVHTLAVKRGSPMAESEGITNEKSRVNQVEQGVELFARVLAQAGYNPYYLYRQKYMKGNMENAGYSLPGEYCLYNMQMIEQRQTIVGLGGGAASKFVNNDFSLSSIYNPKNPQVYCESVDRLITRKVDNLMALN